LFFLNKISHFNQTALTIINIFCIKAWICVIFDLQLFKPAPLLNVTQTHKLE